MRRDHEQEVQEAQGWPYRTLGCREDGFSKGVHLLQQGNALGGYVRLARQHMVHQAVPTVCSGGDARHA